MIFALVAVIAIFAVLLILVVLAQDSKSGALSSNFGATQVMGVKRTTDMLEKLTWGLMIGIMILAMSSKFIVGSDVDAEAPTSVNVEKAKSKPAAQAPSQNLNPTTSPSADSGKK